VHSGSAAPKAPTRSAIESKPRPVMTWPRTRLTVVRPSPPSLFSAFLGATVFYITDGKPNSLITASSLRKWPQF
jgi:hypothetical protein